MLISTNELLFMPNTCLMNATKTNSIYSLADKVLCHNQSKLKKLMCVCVCVCMCVCVCVCVWSKNVADNFSEGWRQTRNYTPKGKKYTQNICDIAIITVLIFCYLIANNQMKCGIIYKKSRSGRVIANE